MNYDYYLQRGPHGNSLRRYPIGQQSGQRWDRGKKAWTDECAPRASCKLTKDEVITRQSAEAYFPEIKSCV